MRTDRQTDVPKLIVAFRNLAKAPKNRECHLIQGAVGDRCNTSLKKNWAADRTSKMINKQHRAVAREMIW